MQSRLIWMMSPKSQRMKDCRRNSIQLMTINKKTYLLLYFLILNAKDMYCIHVCKQSCRYSDCFDLRKGNTLLHY